MAWESTLQGDGMTQDPASAAWNFFTALYYKSNNIPWQLAAVPQNTCFVGVTFYKESPLEGADMQSSLAQVFSGHGEGVVLKGEIHTRRDFSSADSKGWKPEALIASDGIQNNRRLTLLYDRRAPKLKHEQKPATTWHQGNLQTTPLADEKPRPGNHRGSCHPQGWKIQIQFHRLGGTGRGGGKDSCSLVLKSICILLRPCFLINKETRRRAFPTWWPGCLNHWRRRVQNNARPFFTGAR